MKRLIALPLLILACATYAAPPAAEAPVSGYGTPVTVSISNSVMTKIPTSQTSGRMGIFVDNPSSNSGNMVGFLGDCTSTSLASTIRPIEISPSSNTAFYPIREDVCMWLITTNGSAENIHYQEVKQ